VFSAASPASGLWPGTGSGMLPFDGIGIGRSGRIVVRSVKGRATSRRLRMLSESCQVEDQLAFINT